MMTQSIVYYIPVRFARVPVIPVVQDLTFIYRSFDGESEDFDCEGPDVESDRGV